MRGIAEAFQVEGLAADYLLQDGADFASVGGVARGEPFEASTGFPDQEAFAGVGGSDLPQPFKRRARLKGVPKGAEMLQPDGNGGVGLVGDGVARPGQEIG